MNLSDRPTVATTVSILLACVFLAAGDASAKIKLPGIFGDNMVLQSDMPIAVWGVGAAEEEVTVNLGVRKAATTADAKGKWMVKLPAMKPGGPYNLTISGENTVRFKEVLVGEVWLCSGDSYMEYSLAHMSDYKTESAAAKFPQMRLCRVARRSSGLPVNYVKATWVPCDPKAVYYFSSVAYYFGRELHTDLKVPVGLITATYSGSKVEAWTPASAFLAAPKLQQTFVRIVQANKKHSQAMEKALPGIEAWVKDTRTALAKGRTPPAMPPLPAHDFDSPSQPTSLYNGTLHPIVPLALRGAIWYQGYYNKEDGAIYHDKTKALITGWRKAWGQALGDSEPIELPFYFVQMGPYPVKKGRGLPPATLREAQRATLAVANTGMVVTIDLASMRNRRSSVTPRKIGRRLSLWALAKTYRRKGLIYSGPLFKSMEAEGGKIRISFDHVGGGLTAQPGKPEAASGGALKNFQIAGEDKKFVKGEAKIDGNEVVVSSDKVAAPVAVRFGWDEAAGTNLFNTEGLPASPFSEEKK